MPVCKKCQGLFPRLVVIDGKDRSLRNRKYCLQCSPFNVHNTRKLEKIHQADGLNVCEQCGRLYKYGEKGHSLVRCNSCIVNTRRKWIKEKAVEHKGGCCQICGYNKCIHALVFHHKDPDKKLFSISGRYCYGWERIKEEIDKCFLLCHNCHTEIHSGDFTVDKIPERFLAIKKQLKEIISKVCLCGKVFQTKKDDQVCCSNTCAGNKRRKVTRPSKDDLGVLLWEIPTQKIAKQFGVSDKAVEKWAKSYGVDKPPRGYWMKDCKSRCGLAVTDGPVSLRI